MEMRRKVTRELINKTRVELGLRVISFMDINLYVLPNALLVIQ